MTGNQLTEAQVWQVFLFLVLPLLVGYAGLLIASCKRDRHKR
jgi:hypothetical protein